MVEIIYGDAVTPLPQFDSDKYLTIIYHGCNCIGKYSKGFVVPLFKKYPLAARKFSSPDSWFNKKYRTPNDKLGHSQAIIITDKKNLVVVNVYSQLTIWKKRDGSPPIDYKALELACLELFERIPSIVKRVCKHPSTIDGVILQSPAIGTGLAGGDLNIVKDILESTLRKGMAFWVDANKDLISEVEMAEYRRLQIRQFIVLLPEEKQEAKNG